MDYDSALIIVLAALQHADTGISLKPYYSFID
jgi:hypothetical protein